MNWSFDEPSYGSIVRVRFAKNFFHYGIYVSDNEIIQFGKNPLLRGDITDRDVEVCTTDMAEFLNGGFLETESPDKKEAKKRRTGAETVVAARSRLGEKGYSILHNNCEHFAFECAYGTRQCTQVGSVRDSIRSRIGALKKTN